MGDYIKILILILTIWSFSSIAGFKNYIFAVIYLTILPVVLLYFNVIDDVDRKIIRDILSFIKLRLKEV